MDLRRQIACELFGELFQRLALFLDLLRLGLEAAVELDQPLLLPIGVTGQVRILIEQPGESLEKSQRKIKNFRRIGALKVVT